MPKRETPVSVLIKRIDHKDTHVRAVTLKELIARGQWAKEAAPALANSFRTTTPTYERGEILTALLAVNPKSQVTWEVLSSIARDPASPHQEILLDFVEKRRPPEEQAAPLIRTMLEQENNQHLPRVAKLAMRYFSACVINSILSEYFKRGDILIRLGLLSSFEALGRKSPDCVPLLLKTLYELPPTKEPAEKHHFYFPSTREECFRPCLIETLFDLGPGWAKNAPELLEALTSPDGKNHLFDISVTGHYQQDIDYWFSCLHYYYGLNLIDHPQTRDEILPHALQCIRHPNKHTRRFVAELLGHFGEDGGHAVGPLSQALLEDKYYRVRYYSAKSLKMIGEHCREAKNAIPALKKALHDPDFSVRKHSQEALDLF